jgi:hypothetical protein
MRVIWHMMRGCRVTFYEIWSASMTMSWGLFLLLPYDTFSSNPAYGFLSAYVSEEWMGSALLAIGMSVLIASRFGSVSVRRLVMFMLAMVYLFFAVVFFPSAINTHSFVAFHLFFLSGFMGWHYLCLGQRNYYE